MNQASNIKEIYQTFEGEMPLTASEKEFYVDLYGIDFKKFVAALENTRAPNKFFYIAGQSGNGKTTALNLLAENHPSLTKVYNFHTIEVKDVFLYEVDIVDILLMIGYTLVEENETLKDVYLNKLKKISDVQDGTLIEEEKASETSHASSSATANISLGVSFLSILKSGVDFISSYKLNEETRKDARRLFKIKRKELIDLTNEIISEFKSTLDDDKNLVVVIDNLEKLQYNDSLFLKDMALLNELNILKIITMPIYLHRNENIAYATVHEFSLKLSHLDGRENTHDHNLLKEIIEKRVADETLISKDAIEMSVTYSAGNLRQLMRIISEAAMDAMAYDMIKINKKNVETAVEIIGKQLSPKVMTMRTFLEQIKESKAHNDDDESRKNIATASKRQLVFAHFNGVVWYEINPIITHALEVYSKHENTSD